MGAVAALRKLRALIVPAMLPVAVGACGLVIRQATIAYFAVDAQLSPDHLQLQLSRQFVERYRNRVSIDARMEVDQVAGMVNPPPLDGDLHISGRSAQVELPMVAEIANAGDEHAAVDLVRATQKRGGTLALSGVWRIWPEHGKKAERQDSVLDPLKHASPDHLFEIHPIIRLNGLSLLNTFRPVKGFTPGGAQRTFGIFEKATCTVGVKGDKIVLVLPTGLYNDIEFVMQLIAAPQQVVGDGRFVMVTATDLSGRVMVDRLRLVFARNTPPEIAVRSLHSGDRLRVYGMPRLNLQEISGLARTVALSDSAGKGVPLPYEIIVLGVFPTLR